MAETIRTPYSKFQAFCRQERITLDEIGELLGMDKSMVSKRMNGTGADFSADDVRKICLHYGISADVFFVDKEVSFEKPNNDGKSSSDKENT